MKSGPRGGQPVFTPKKRKEFLKWLGETANVRGSALMAGISHTLAYTERKRNPKFAEEWDRAIEKGICELEAEARRRAFAGVEEEIYHNGMVVGTKKKHSDLLTIFLLKARRPDVYKDRTENTNKNENKISIDEVSNERLREIAAKGVVYVTKEDDDDSCS